MSIANFDPYFLDFKGYQRNIFGLTLIIETVARILHKNLIFLKNIFFLPLEYCAVDTVEQDKQIHFVDRMSQLVWFYLLLAFCRHGIH